uniref:Alternative protein SNX33 n=1 Tax=Homo sapiens TaxID=9606 RepID=L8E981_HUMAN|nr:alternative protein SNX33 [Homo sapiens]
MMMMTGMTGTTDAQWWRSHGLVGWAPTGTLPSTSPTLVPTPASTWPSGPSHHWSGRTAWHLPSEAVWWAVTSTVSHALCVLEWRPSSWVMCP